MLTREGQYRLSSTTSNPLDLLSNHVLKETKEGQYRLSSTTSNPLDLLTNHVLKETKEGQYRLSSTTSNPLGLLTNHVLKENKRITRKDGTGQAVPLQTRLICLPRKDSTG